MQQLVLDKGWVANFSVLKPLLNGIDIVSEIRTGGPPNFSNSPGFCPVVAPINLRYCASQGRLLKGQLMISNDSGNSPY